MRHLALPRMDQTVDGTFGHLLDEENKPFGVTLEPPWLGNAPEISCVPAGTYLYSRRYSGEHGCDVFAAANIPNRTDIEIHPGCLLRDTKGCHLLGTAFGFVDYADGKPGASGHGITGSRDAFEAFMRAMTNADDVLLTITDPLPDPSVASL